MVHTNRILRTPVGLSPLRKLISHYDGLLCDIWGVLHNGDAALSEAIEALCKTRATGRFVILLTNAPRLSKDIYPQLARFGVPRDAFDTIVTSGDVTAQLIAKQPKAALFHFGPERDRSVLEGLTNPIVDLARAELCLLTGPLDDAIETVDLYGNDLEVMCKNNVEMICANPDLVVRSGNRMVICAGSIAQRYAQMGGRVTYAGKPEPAIYDEALRRAAILTGRDIPKCCVLAIGDGLPTDIKGAADSGLDAYFVASGIHASEFGALNVADNAVKAAGKIMTRFKSLKLVGVCDRLSWS
ncbi:HAD-superfamily class IIA hydrolase, TIGR01459 [Litoreibacter ascidiaceicola]|uniref:HAD-superfamily class IIA hydrolase, TIGR01459 n=1 Tax=Litoreibacter ascidiaceicola TaxID=1486859 RepID=A0A1M5AI57_9RHOB|nr:TIGR01459 family HAD-type hydrolase [Litoreibacter ascidiaceicola]SHF29572.1 HAD-superfamily class IIA hydrolase, TIGR01459 [Litoreibacter ascidiaceicola]